MDDNRMTNSDESSGAADRPCAYVVNVQRFTIHDGPGIRTELFLKGCSLRCQWCSNPETYEPFPQVGVFPKKCIGCGYCLKACAAHGHNALLTDENGITGIDRSRCDNCLLCEAECMSGALSVWGKKMTADDAMDVIRRDREFYDRSGGGVTLSGGEALLQPEFCREVLKRCREEEIHTCVESALHVSPVAIDRVAPFTQLFITDIKQMVNDNTAYIDATSDFILNALHNKPLQIQLLKYRPLGEEKAETLGLPMEMKALRIENREEFEARIRGYVRRMNERGIPAIPGSRGKPETDPKEA